MRLFSGDFNTILLTAVSRLIVIFAILPIHECAHAWAADKLGDPTAKRLGRLTVNPLVHIDWIGAACLLVAGMGWAKPVPINPMYFRNRKYGMALSALAGPVANLVMGAVVTVLYKLLAYSAIAFGWSGTPVTVLLTVLLFIAQISVLLAVFNLLPIPPLDGSRILLLVLPERAYFGLMRYERYIQIGLFALLFLGVLDVPLGFLQSGCLAAIDWLTDWVPMLFGY